MENKHSSEEQSSDWAQVESPYSAISSHFIGDRHSIILKDDFFGDSSDFPPPNHEDLPITTPQDNNQISQECELTDSSTSPTPESGISKWRKSRYLGFLQSGITWMVSKSRTNIACKLGYWPFVSTVGGLASFMIVFFLRRRIILWWHRRIRVNKSDESLMLLIDQKDEKIKQLLLQIAQMNEMLQARRKVPVIRVKTSS